MILWSGDPGTTHGVAVAEFYDNVFAAASFRKTPPRAATLWPSVFVMELPMIYPGDFKADPNDVMALRDQVGEWRYWAHSRGIDFVEATPSQWKSGTKKPIHHRRIWKALSAAERDAFCRSVTWGKRTPADVAAYIDQACLALARTGVVRGYSRKDHNLLDSVGLGLWRLRRIDNAGRMI